MYKYNELVIWRAGYGGLLRRFAPRPHCTLTSFGAHNSGYEARLLQSFDPNFPSGNFVKCHMLVAIIFKGYELIGTILTRTKNDERGKGRRTVTFSAKNLFRILFQLAYLSPFQFFLILLNHLFEKVCGLLEKILSVSHGFHCFYHI